MDPCAVHLRPIVYFVYYLNMKCDCSVSFCFVSKFYLYPVFFKFRLFSRVRFRSVVGTLYIAIVPVLIGCVFLPVDFSNRPLAVTGFVLCNFHRS